MKIFRLLVVALLAGSFAMTGCKKEESVGDKVDKAAEATGDAVKKGADAAGDAVKKAGDAVEDATE